ncbi:HAUS augmin-like complex subunit 3 [Dorcoceras hygrometricum]|uniref:HAUS augmin-like complex subunit 3 n=1 Tax=Dorcoceras hygrometricum TaxID=472368 RepID=A0A2Z7AH83_9LAMI|nr:HAUS augmin-like complex subunit 3 [Dorcoceras hygrometricum]
MIALELSGATHLPADHNMALIRFSINHEAQYVLNQISRTLFVVIVAQKYKLLEEFPRCLNQSSGCPAFGFENQPKVLSDQLVADLMTVRLLVLSVDEFNQLLRDVFKEDLVFDFEHQIPYLAKYFPRLCSSLRTLGCEGERQYRTLISLLGSLATMLRVVNYHSSWARHRQVELFDASGNPGFTAGRGFNPAGGAPGGG